MRIASRVDNREGSHHIILRTGDNAHSINIPPKSGGLGSSANGGELLFLALATCYCNDIYREASKRGMKVERVEVEVEGDFGAEGEPASRVTYHARVTAHASEAEIRDLMQHTDSVAEIQNTLRNPITIALSGIEAVPA